MPRKNSRYGTCDCGTAVQPQAGYIYKRDTDRYWQVSCTSTACLDAHGIVMEDPTPRLSAAGMLTFPYDPERVAIVKSLPYPTRRWDGDSKAWDLRPGLESDRYRPTVLDACQRIGAEIADCWLTTTTTPDPLVEAALSRARQGNAEGLKAYNFQLDGVRWLAEHPRALMADDMGLGKTAQTLWALPEGARCLVVCPASLKLNWASEVRRWRPDLAARVVSGRQKTAKGIHPAEGEVVIVNYDILPTEKTLVTEGLDWSEVTLVTDEAHAVKSHKAARSKRINALAPQCGRVWAITGTPLLGKPLDLWGVLSSHDMASDVFGGWHSFLRVFGGVKGRWGGYEFARTPKPEAPTLMGRVMIRRKKEDVWEGMPSRRYQLVHVPVEGELEYLLDSMYDEQLEEGLLKGLLPAFDEMAAIRAQLAHQRIGALVEMVESYEEAGEPVVVFSAHREPVLTLGDRDGWAVITGSTSQADRQAAVEAFQRGDLKGIAGTVGAMGVGLTLTRASTMIFNDLDWTPALNRQAEDRICRIGQTAASCHYIKLVSAHPLDLRVMQVLEQKAALVEATLDAEGAALPTVAVEEAPAVVQETDAERQARVDAYAATKAAADAAAEAVKLRRVRWSDLTDKQKTKRAKATVEESQERWLASYGARRGRPDVTVSDSDRAMLLEALESMLGVCDGARERDESGFSKADVLVSRLLWYDGLRSDEAALAAWSLLRGYRRQLGGIYPGIFEGYRLVPVEQADAAS